MYGAMGLRKQMTRLAYGLRLRAKIMLGFVIVLAISAASITVASLGFERVVTGVSSYRETVAESDAARDIDRELAMYQGLVRYYAVTGNAADEAAGRAAEVDLGKAIERAQSVASSQRRQQVSDLASKFDDFTDLFRQIVGLKAESATIASKELSPMADLFRRRIASLSDAADSAAANAFQSAANELEMQFALTAANVSNFIVKTDSALFKEEARLVLALQIGISELRSPNETLTKGAKELSNLLAAYHDAFTRLADKSFKVDVLTGKMAVAAAVIVDDAKVVKDDLATKQQSVSEQLGAVARDTAGFVTILGAGGVALGALLAWLLGRGISRPMTAMCAAMRKLAAGDFDVVLPGLGRRDEIGEMAGAVEEFKVQAVKRAEYEAAQREQRSREGEAARRADLNRFADDFEAAVGGIVTNVSSSAQQLENSAFSLKRTVEMTQELSGRVADASGKASANVQSVASATEQLSASVVEIRRQAQESSRIAESAVVQAERTDERITQLSEAAQQIGSVVKLITMIAEQTDLLALNATIEAARAGEAGRGFAVVASEVKSLASQTAKATDEISSHIAGMQEATQLSVSAIKEIGETIGRISRISGTIALSVEQQSAATQEIAKSVQSVARGTQEVAGSITEVNRGANETGTASGEVSNSARVLSAESARLREELERFMSSVRSA